MSNAQPSTIVTDEPEELEHFAQFVEELRRLLVESGFALTSDVQEVSSAEMPGEVLAHSGNRARAPGPAVPPTRG